MKITETRNNKINFKAGLNNSIRHTIQNIDVPYIENAFLKEFNVKADFKDNRIWAGCCAYVANIFEELTQKFNLPFSATPPRIKVFERFFLQHEVLGNCFCISNTAKILADEPPVEIRSIFLEKTNCLETFENNIENWHKQKLRSSGHFLSDTIHEWCHNIHMDAIFKRFGYEGTCPYAKSLYKNDKIKKPRGESIIEKFNECEYTPKEKELIHNYLGLYATTSKMELFAETLTKLITDSLHKKTLLPKYNPLKKTTIHPTVYSLFEDTMKF